MNGWSNIIAMLQSEPAPQWPCMQCPTLLDKPGETCSSRCYQKQWRADYKAIYGVSYDAGRYERRCKK